MKYLQLLLFLVIYNTAGAAIAKRHVFDVPVPNMVADTDTIIRKKSISVGVSYGSDAMFFGRTGPITYPFMSADVVYNFKSGFFVYGSVLRLLGYRTFVDEVDLGGGYLYRPSKNFSAAVSYNRFIFNKEQRIIESATNNDINLKNSYDWKYLKSTVTLDYLFGRSNDFFVTIGHSKYIEPKWGVFDNNDYLSFNPGFNVILGTQNFVRTYSLDHTERFIAQNIFKSGYDTPNLYNNGRFNVLNYSFKLPVAYNRAHYTLEATYKYSIPVNVQGALMNKRESFFNLTFYYLFF